MALDFNAAAGNSVLASGDTSTDNLTTGTMISWYKPLNAFVGNDTIGAKVVRPAFGAYRGILHEDTLGNITISVNRATSVLVARSNDTPLNIDEWNYVAGVFDVGGVGGDQKLYWGNLNTIVAEVGGYITQDVGSGSQNDDSSGNEEVCLAINGDGADIISGIYMLWDRVLTLGEIRAQQFRPHVTSGCVVYWQLGYTGITTQADWSGNGNAGIITGTTLSPHVLIPPPFGFSEVLPFSGIGIFVGSLINGGLVNSGLIGGRLT